MTLPLRVATPALTSRAMMRVVVRRTRVLLAVAGAAALTGGAALLLDRRSDDGPGGESAITDVSIVMLGDSITAQGDWSELLPELPIVNRGRSGFTTQQLVSVAGEVASRQPRAVVILTGTNDIRDGHDAAWTGGYLTAILDAFRGTAPGTQVVLQTVLPRGDAPDAVRQANAAIAKLAADRDLLLVDLNHHFDDGRGALRATDTTDGIHLTPAGYARWAALLQSDLASLV
jgi:lysophospholipase L1-like esterase